MKKGDKVLARDNHEDDWFEAIYDHEHEGRHFAIPEIMYGHHLSVEWRFCKPAKQSAEEWTHEWAESRKGEYLIGRGLISPLIDYYNDRKKWEES